MFLPFRLHLLCSQLNKAPFVMSAFLAHSGQPYQFMLQAFAPFDLHQSLSIGLAI